MPVAMATVGRSCVPWTALVVFAGVLLTGQAHGQDMGSFLAGLLGASEAPRNTSTSEQDQMPCPGECVHALTSILCSKVVEQFDCGAGYLRCCVSSDFTFGTVVETSAPLPEEFSTESTAEYDVFLLTTVPDGAPTTKQTSPSPTRSPVIVTRKSRPCPGICVENIFVRYCGTIIPDGICEKGSTCCASSQDDSEVRPLTVSTPATKTTAENAYDGHQANHFTVTSPTPLTLPGPPCPGSCVAPLFSLLCDAVEDSYHCANDGRCCVSKEEPYTSTPTTTQPPSPSIPCPGACIPMFLQGMCNNPSELIPVTECDEDFVCCYQPEVKEHIHIEAQQIPLLRPVASQLGYPPIPLPQNNVSPMRQPSISQPYPQRPQLAVIPNPVIVPHQVAGNQVYLPHGRPEFHAVQQPKRQAAAVVKNPYQPNNNYGVNPYQHQSFVPMRQQKNSSVDIQTVRLTVLAPLNQAGSAHSEGMNRNVSQILPPYPNVESDPLRLIAPPSSVPSVSQQHPDDVLKQQNVHDRFVETAIGFAPDTLKPIKIKVPQKSPPLEKFHPPSSRPTFRPKLRNTSTILVLHVDEPDNIEVIQGVEVVEPVKPLQNSFKPLLPQNTFKPISPLVPTRSTVPVVISEPVRADAEPNPPVEDIIAKPSNTNFYTISAEQAKKIRPACPGSCIASFLRFTCFGNNAIYDGFVCEGSSILCCTSVDYIEKYEEHLKSGTPLTFIKPDSKGGQTSVDTTRRPGMYVCGIKGSQRRGRIMGGRTASPGEWCWQVALINSKNQYLCGGALVGSRWILTAAHCITALVRNGDAIYVRVGDFDLASQMGSPGAQTQKVSTSYIHHNHNGQTLDNDIALLRLENPIQLQDSVCLVCLPARGAESQPGKRCTVTGYGYLSQSGPISLKVRQTELPIVEEVLCAQQINKVTEKRFILPAGSFCAGGELENDACQGDGGGPLTCLNEGYHELTGLVSWGFGCGKEDVPGVYVKVSSYIGWINQIISVNN